ncbi:MAG TPA: hypothetical protein DDW52_25255, partial [Planctomycetaceae bacterium]|nr:hypothetical protein [Planctomycetaceae bacterium]
LEPMLETVRRQIAEDEAAYLRRLGGLGVQVELPVALHRPVPTTGFFELPMHQLLAYYVDRDASPIGKLLSATKRMAAQVDQVVVVGSNEYLLAAQMLMEACAQPRFNSLTRGQRGSRPRVHFVSTSADNDAVQALLYVLANPANSAFRAESSWALLSFAAKPDCPVLLSFMDAAESEDCGSLAQSRMMAIRESGGTPSEMEAELELELPPGLTPFTSALSAIGLAPAALLGVNIMKLQEGALAMAQHFREAAFCNNLPVLHAVASHLVRTRDRQSRVQTDVISMHAVARWANRLLASGRTSSGMRADGEPELIWQIVSKRSRFDTLPRFKQKANMQGDPATGVVPIELPDTDEASLGQLLQLMMLSQAIQIKLCV